MIRWRATFTDEPGPGRRARALPWPILAATLLALGFAAEARGDEVDRSLVDQGRTLAETHCGSCHAVSQGDPSPLAEAPPLRDLSKRYPLAHLEEALAEGIVTGHDSMPEWAFDPPEIDALVAFLGSLADP